MTRSGNGGGLLRVRDERGRRVTFAELFFDLVYAFAVTQLAHLLLEHLSVRGALQTLLLLLAVWWAWVYNAWFTNWFDPDRRAVRLLVGAVMLASLLMSATVPEAFTQRGLLFAGSYAAMQVGRGLFAVAALRAQPGLRRNFQRILTWSLAAGALWLAGGFADGSARGALWLAAVAVDYAAPVSGFFTPGLGRSRTTDWTIAGEHLAERCQQFLLIALGEAVLDTGAAFGQLHTAATAVAPFMVAFVGNAGLWWVYFDRSAEDGSAVIAQADDPGRLGRSAYTYLHLPMVAGIIVTAVGDELTIADPSGHTVAATSAILGGAALFLAGHALFKWAVFGRVSVPRIAALAVLAALVPVSVVVPALALAAGVALAVVSVAAWDTRLYRRLPPRASA